MPVFWGASHAVLFVRPLDKTFRHYRAFVSFVIVTVTACSAVNTGKVFVLGMHHSLSSGVLLSSQRGGVVMPAMLMSW